MSPIVGYVWNKKGERETRVKPNNTRCRRETFWTRFWEQKLFAVIADTGEKIQYKQNLLSITSPSIEFFLCRDIFLAVRIAGVSHFVGQLLALQ